MPRNHQQLEASIERSQAARDPRRRFINLCVQFEVVDGDNAGWRSDPYGGIWDKDRGEFSSYWDPDRGGWTGDAATPHVIRVAAQSIDAVQDWVHSMILILGGRRSGKTTGTLAPKIIVLLIMFVGMPGTVLSPTYRQSMNVWRAICRHTPDNWWAYRNKSERRMRLINGAELVLLSADRDDSARSEGCAWQVNDERQDISEEAAGNAQLSASEASGPGAHIVVETATIKPELREHYDRVVKSSKGAVYAMGSFANPFIDHSFLEDAMEFLDEERVMREIHAQWPEVVGRVYYPFNEVDHVRDFPAEGWRDCTAAFCLDRLGLEAQFILGVDPPRHAIIAKIGAGEIAHVIDEVVVGSDGTDGDVRKLAKACRAICGNAPAIAIFDPHETHWSRDVSKYFRGEKFRPVGMRRVHIEYRVTSVRARLERNALLIASKCVHLRESMRDQLYVSGKPDKLTSSKITPIYTLDHPPDALGYFVYRFWPSEVDYERMEQAA